MNDQSHQGVLMFRKAKHGKELFCRLEVFSDGSAFAEGDEVEIIFEESPDTLHQAITELEKLGYTRILTELETERKTEGDNGN